MIEMKYKNGQLQILHDVSPSVAKLIHTHERRAQHIAAAEAVLGHYLRSEVERQVLNAIRRSLDSWISERLLWRDSRGRWELVP